MVYLLALIPALGWGLMPLITGKIGGSAVNQLFGIGAGATIIGLVAYAVTQPTVSTTAFWFSVLCGALWTIGQVGQFVSFKRMGVSNTMPLSTVLQLVGNSLIGVALAIVIVGALMTSVSDSNSDKKVTASNFIFLLVTTIGYWVYSAFPKIPIVANESAQGIFLPEMLGILLGSVIYALCSGNASSFKQKEQYLNILGGLSWGIAAFAYIFSAKALGVTEAFIFTQLNVIIATFGGIWILHEHKSHREMAYTIWGIVLIVVGSIATAFA